MRGTWRMIGSAVLAVSLLVPALPWLAATPAEGGRFWDDDGNTHERNIEAIAAEGVTLGCVGEGTAYCPELGVTRAQMASFLARALSLSPVPGDRFSDVSTTSVHKENINAIADRGITLGCDADGTLFCPNQVLNRAQMASFMARALNLAPVADGPFTDSDTAPTHEPNINAIASAEITIGCNTEGTLYCPYNTVTRSQMASFLARGLGYDPIAVAPRLDLTPFMDCVEDGCTGSGSYTGNSPFFIRHGWIFAEDDPDFDQVKDDPNTGFVLFMDQEDEFPSTAITSTFQDEVARYDTIDFPAGLSGEHEFEAQWIRLGEVVQTWIITIDFG